MNNKKLLIGVGVVLIGLLLFRKWADKQFRGGMSDDEKRKMAQLEDERKKQANEQKKSPYNDDEKVDAIFLALFYMGMQFAKAMGMSKDELKSNYDNFQKMKSGSEVGLYSLDKEKLKSKLSKVSDSDIAQLIEYNNKYNLYEKNDKDYTDKYAALTNKIGKQVGMIDQNVYTTLDAPKEFMDMPSMESTPPPMVNPNKPRNVDEVIKVDEKIKKRMEEIKARAK